LSASPRPACSSDAQRHPYLYFDHLCVGPNCLLRAVIVWLGADSASCRPMPPGGGGQPTPREGPGEATPFSSMTMMTAASSQGLSTQQRGDRRFGRPQGTTRRQTDVQAVDAMSCDRWERRLASCGPGGPRLHCHGESREGKAENQKLPRLVPPQMKHALRISHRPRLTLEALPGCVEAVL